MKNMRNRKGQFTTRKKWFSENSGIYEFPAVEDSYNKACETLQEMLDCEQELIDVFTTAERNALKVTDYCGRADAVGQIYPNGNVLIRKNCVEKMQKILKKKICQQAEYAAIAESRVI